jgi:hypothetical protein
MNCLILLTGGRSGSDFLQSLLDSHPEILQFPGIVNLTKDLYLENDPKNILNIFYNSNKYFFDSRLNVKERLDKLGKFKNEYFKVSVEKFYVNFIKIYKKTNKSNLQKIIALHKAYALSYGQDIKKKKIVVIHLHVIEYLRLFNKFINVQDMKILITYRDPLVSLKSTVNHWSQYCDGKYLTASNLFWNINLHTNIFNQINFFSKNLYVIRLEDLHHHSKIVLKKFCKILKIKFNKNLLKSTYLNKKWWGDAISNKELNGLNKKFKNVFSKNIYFFKDIFFLEKKLKIIIPNFGYSFRSKKSFNFFMIFLPLKCELIVWMNLIKLFKLKNIIEIPFFYLKRILLFIKNEHVDQQSLPIIIR